MSPLPYPKITNRELVIWAAVALLVWAIFLIAMLLTYVSVDSRALILGAWLFGLFLSVLIYRKLRQ